jgi:trehalose synthase
MHEVPLTSRPIDALAPFARRAHLARFRSIRDDAAAGLNSGTLWHVNSTAEGGGVAELLHQVLGYVIDGGIACRWAVIDGDPEFFRITKRIHNRLHGSTGDGGDLGDEERRAYDRVLAREGRALLELVRPGDVVELHDPQTAGLIRPLVESGVKVIWVCHIGVDRPDDVVRSGWDFLRPDVTAADAYVFSRRAYLWKGLDRAKAAVIPPCIDPLAPKNAELSPIEVHAILGAAGIVDVPSLEVASVALPDDDPVEILHRAESVEEAPAPAGAPLVAQISRWDRLKDHVGVLRGFADHVRPDLDAHLLLVGPRAVGVTDDPEGAEVLTEVETTWRSLPDAVRARIHLVSLPTDDRVENAVIVNAIQRRADVVVQKSIAEGFGLTVAEAMWKLRAVVASRVGGIRDQIVDARSGWLIDPTDLTALGEAISALIGDLGFAHAMGHAARERVRDRFLPPHFLGGHLALVGRVLGRPDKVAG